MAIVRAAIAIGVMPVCCSPVAAQGIVAPGAGLINRAMAGASTAAPVDFGSSYWNPANISGLDRSEFLLGTELMITSTHLETPCRQVPSMASCPARVALESP